MPYDSNGNFSLVPGYFVQNGDDVLPSQHNPPLEDIGSGLGQVLLRNGVAPLTGNLNANGNKIINLAAPTNPNDALRLADLVSRPKFLAYKNGVNQSVTLGNVKITYPTEVFDLGGYYDAANSTWRPPAGKYRISAGYSAKSSVFRAMTIELRKNGVAEARGHANAPSNITCQPQFSRIVETDGTYDFDIYGVQVDGTFIGDILGLITDTWFCGEAV